MVINGMRLADDDVSISVSKGHGGAMGRPALVAVANGAGYVAVSRLRPAGGRTRAEGTKAASLSCSAPGLEPHVAEYQRSFVGTPWAGWHGPRIK